MCDRAHVRACVRVCLCVCAFVNTSVVGVRKDRETFLDDWLSLPLNVWASKT